MLKIERFHSRRFYSHSSFIFFKYFEISDWLTNHIRIQRRVPQQQHTMSELALNKLINDENVVRIIESKTHLELAKYLGNKLCSFTEDDEKYIDIFWDTTFNKSWLYVTDHMVNVQFGYENSKYMMSNFNKKLINEYENNVDYKQVDKDHELVKVWLLSKTTKNNQGGFNKHHFIITGETYKSLLQSAHTEKGKLTRKYFIKVEHLANITNQAIFKFIEIKKDQQLQEQTQLIAKLERKQLKLNSFIRNIKTLEKNQIFYISTTQNYARQNRFEYGGVSSADGLQERLPGYNTGRAEGDLYYYTKIYKCNNYKLIEERINSVLQQFKDKIGSRKEMVHLRYNRFVEFVDFICENYDREVEYINASCQQFLNDTIELEGIVPEPVDINACFADMQLVVRKNGKTKIQKIDISDWPDAKINETIEAIINLCAEEKKKIKYNVAQQKNSLAVELTWGLLSPYLDVYAGLTKTDWRVKFRDWFNKEKPKQLRIKGVKV